MKSYKSAEAITVLLLPFLLFLSSAALLFAADKTGLLLPIVANCLSLMNMLGGSKFSWFFIVLSLFLLSYFLYVRFITRDDTGDIVKAAGSLAVLILISSFGSIMLAVAVVSVYFLVSPDNVLHFTQAIESLELKIFGGLPEFASINALTGSLMEDAIIFFYGYLYLLIPFSMVFIGRRKVNFKRTFVGYFLAFSLLIPIWYAIPILSPHAVYLSKSIQTGYSPSDVEIIYGNSSGFYKETTAFYEKVWISKSFFAVSSFPSFHVYLAMLFAYYLAKTEKRWLGFSVVWVAFTIVGTFYTLQHYFLDAMAGILFASFVIGALNRFIREEPDDDSLYYICEFLDKAVFARLQGSRRGADASSCPRPPFQTQGVS